MSMGAAQVHEFASPEDGGLCKGCGKKECGEAFWRMLGAPDPANTRGLRLRGDKASFIKKDDP